MKQILLILCTACSCGRLCAQETLSDRWKETQRLDLKKKAVAYTDTLRISGITKDEMNIRKGAFQYKGKIENDVLDLGYLTYGIMKNNQTEVQLRDEEFIHIFTREKKDMSAADASAGKANIDLPAAPVREISPEMLKGDWEAYKRSNRSGPVAKVDYKTLIKTLSFSPQKTKDYYGAITTDFIGGNALYHIKDTKAPALLLEDKDKKEHTVKVWRLTAEELVIEDEAGVVYYMKHFQ